MNLIGIIANPSSGKDIRRLVAEAAGTDNRHKVNSVRRILLGIAAVGIDEVALMPDWFGIGRRALQGLTLPFRVTHLEMVPRGTQEDSLEAARLLGQREAALIVVLGGDGTQRVVAKACGSVPLLPISAGTNNVWAQPTEPTLAGLAAALVARGVVPLEEAVRPTKKLEILREGRLLEIALVDVATYDGALTGSKAVWDTGRVKELVIATVEAGTLGLSSIGSGLPKPAAADGAGLYVRLGAGRNSVLAAVAPGMVCRVPIQDYHWLEPGEEVQVRHRPCILALDGEREIVLSETDPVRIRLTRTGPGMVDVRNTLRVAAERGWFVEG